MSKSPAELVAEARAYPKAGLTSDRLLLVGFSQGTMMALHARARTGRGQIVDAAIYESVLSVMENLITEYGLTGYVRERSGSILPGIAPSNTYLTADGAYVVIAGNSDPIYKRLMHTIGRADLAEAEEFAHNDGRAQHAEGERQSATAAAGSAAIAHSAARTPYPAREGIVALLEPFIDTVVICTMTALVIIITNQHIVGGADGVQLTSNAFATIGDWTPYALAVIDYGQEHNLIWVTAITETGEIWCAPNPVVRMQANWTMGRAKPPIPSPVNDSCVPIAPVSSG